MAKKLNVGMSWKEGSKMTINKSILIQLNIIYAVKVQVGNLLVH